MLSPQQITSEIFSLYEQFGAAEYSGEKISQLEHMSQTGMLAMEEGYDDEVVLAAFLHDIGHLLPVHDPSESMDGYGTLDHEQVGAEWLRRLGAGERLCSLVASHVNAKRYLTYIQPEYYRELSPASKKTLEYQGGVMTPSEAAAFEQDPLFNLFIRMRKWDEAAKVEGRPLPDLGLFRKKLMEYFVRRKASF